MTAYDARTVGRRLARWRTETVGLSQHEFIAALNDAAGEERFRRSWLAAIETGIRSIMLDDLGFIAATWGTTVGALLGEDGPLVAMVRPYEGRLSVAQRAAVANVLEGFGVRVRAR